VNCPVWPAVNPVLTPFAIQKQALGFTITDALSLKVDKSFVVQDAQLPLELCCPTTYPQALFSLPDSVCAGTAVFLEAQNKDCSFEWEWTIGGAGAFFSYGAQLSPLIWESPGTYSIVLTESTGTCNSQYEDTLVVVPQPVTSLFAVHDTLVCPDTPLIIQSQATGFEAWQWSDGWTGSAREWPMPKAGIWWLTASRPYCSVTDSIRVSLGNCSPSRVFVPNVFSPNDDGENDIWEVFFQYAITPVSCKVYDRWGNECFFSGEGQSVRWNGDAQGRPVPSGVYVWQIRFLNLKGTVETRSGDLLLIR
jgi:gliding motility-associated-like protein